MVEHLDVQQGLDGLLQLLLVHLGAVLQLLVGHGLAVVEGEQHGHLVGGHHRHVGLGQVVHLHFACGEEGIIHTVVTFGFYSSTVLDEQQQKKKISVSAGTCAQIVQPGQLPPAEVLIVEQLELKKREREGEEKTRCSAVIPPFDSPRRRRGVASPSARSSPVLGGWRTWTRGRA